MTKDEALKLAMEALEEINKLSIGENAICLPAEIDTAMDAIKEALAQDALDRKAENARELGLNYEPEPVAETMRQMLEVQGQHGNWNYDSYMHGLYNGMEYMVALAEKREPKFRDAPEIWLAKYEVKRDNFNSTEPLTESTEVKHD